MIVGISGKMGSGKSVLMEQMLLSMPNYKRMGFADILKRETADKINFQLDWCYSQEGKKESLFVAVVYGHLSYSGEEELAKAFNDKFGHRLSVSVRELLQWYGTDVCRAKDPDYWVKAMDKALFDSYGSEHPRVIIDDVRFPNEAQFVKDNGGLLVRIAEYPGWKPGEYAEHVSETALDDYFAWNLLLHPDYGDLPFAARLAVNFIIEHGG